MNMLHVKVPGTQCTRPGFLRRRSILSFDIPHSACQKTVDKIGLAFAGDFGGAGDADAAVGVIDCAFRYHEQAALHGVLGGHIVPHEEAIFPQPLEQAVLTDLHAVRLMSLASSPIRIEVLEAVTASAKSTFGACSLSCWPIRRLSSSIMPRTDFCASFSSGKYASTNLSASLT